MISDTAEQGPARRRSTFYVPLSSPSTQESPKKPSPKRTPPARTPPVRSPSAKIADRSATPKPVIRRSSPSKSPLRPRPVVPGVPGKPPHSPTARIRSPLLKVSAKLLSSSAQALEAIKSPSASPSKRSPLALVRRSSSRKLTRSSSSLITRTEEPPLIVIEQLQDETILINSAADKALEKRHLKVDEDEAVHSGKSAFTYPCTPAKRISFFRIRSVICIIPFPLRLRPLITPRELRLYLFIS